MGRQGTPRSDAPRTGMLRRAGAYATAHRQRRRWYGVVGVLAAVVACVTALALSLPASTMTGAAALPEGAQVPEGYTRQYSAEDPTSGVAVAVHAADGVVPEGAELKVNLLGQDTSEYAAAEQELAAQAKSAGEADYGFAALDIRFEDAGGNEVEPAGDVYVVIDADGILPEDVDPESVTVQHLAEKDEGVVVEAVADAVDATDGVVAAEDTAVRAAFAVDGFSTFVITFDREKNYPDNNLRAHLVDESGEELDIDVDFGDLDGMYHPSDFMDKFINGQWISIEELAGTWASQTQGYVYQGAYADSRLDTQVRWVKATLNEADYFWEDDRVEWRYSDSQVQPASHTTGRELSALYLVYEPITQNPDDTELTITDAVANSGSLVANYSGQTQSDDLYYVWSKSVSGSDWNTITRLKMNGNQYNLTENGQTLNVALEVTNDRNDIGGQWFRVAAYASESAYESGLDPIATSSAMQLEYYDELRNGSFENPVVSDLGTTNGNYQYPNGTEGLIWQTTGLDRQIEIVDAGSDASSGYYYTDSAAEGNQFAELNAEASGALYQDVLTVPGTELNWQLYHRGRGSSAGDAREDTMYLLIAPTDEVSDIYTQNELSSLITNIQRNPSVYASRGYFLRDFSDDNDSWVRYSSDDRNQQAYTVPNEQYLTRFFFVAGQTAAPQTANGWTIGNLLDDVKFTTELLPAQAGEANLTVTKVVTGVDGLDIDKYKVEILVTGHGINETITLDNFSEQANGSYLASGQLTGIEVPGNGSVTLSLSENASELQGYELSSTSVSVNGEVVSDNEYSITLEERETGTVVFTNAYEDTTADLTIVKNIYGLTQDQVIDLIDGSYRTDGVGLRFDVDYFSTQEGAEKDDYNGDAFKGDWTFTASDTLTDIPFDGESGSWGQDIHISDADLEDEDEESHYGGSSLVAKTTADGETYYEYRITISDASIGDFYHVWETHLDVTDYSVEATVSTTASPTFDTEHSGGAVTFQLEEDTTVTFTNRYTPATTDVVFRKVDSDNTSMALSGAQFILSYVDSTGDGSVTKYWSEDGWVESESGADPFTSSDEGFITLSGIQIGTVYSLTEVKAPNGYNLLSDPITISWRNGAAVPEIKGEQLESGSIQQGDIATTYYMIKNSTGVELPSTGGPGTTIATIGGIALVAAAGCGYGLRRSRERRGAQS